MTVFLILTAIAYGIFQTGCIIQLVVKGYQGWTLFWKNYDRLPHIYRKRRLSTVWQILKFLRG